MVRITMTGLTPYQVGWSNRIPFSGNFVEDLLGRGDIVESGPDRLVIEDSAFGLSGIIRGTFVFGPDGAPVEYNVRAVHFLYQGQSVQKWTGLGWTEKTLEPALEAYENGDNSAIRDFLDEDRYTFVKPKSAETGPFVIGSDNPDRIFVKGNILDDGNTVFSLGGNDLIDMSKARGGATVESGNGSDRVLGSKSADHIRSGKGNDVVKGGKGSDNIDGSAGNDKIFGGAGDDVYLTGGRGNDLVRGGAGNDHINDSRGTNRIFGDGGADDIRGRGTLKGGGGDDMLNAIGRNNTLIGGAGDDELRGSGTFHGGTGDDMLSGAYNRQDTFDFRLKRADGFGNDKLLTISSFGPFSSETPDQLMFDEGVDISLRYAAKRELIFLTAELDGETIGTVQFGDRFNLVTSGEAAQMMDRIEDALVFV